MSERASPRAAPQGVTALLTERRAPSLARADCPAIVTRAGSPPNAASAFEIATKVRLGKLSVPPAMLNDFAYVVEADGLRLLDVDAASAIRAGQLPGAPRDPFDRLIAAQAAVISGAVVANDAAFAALGVDLFW